ncbi:MAG: CPBP family intramembrane glutamic endopeptidase [Candidatus Aenigmatarchaeota archaeon]
MVDWFGSFPVAPLLFAFLIPIVYSLVKRKELKSILLMTACSVGVVAFYPITNFLSSSIPLFGYLIGKVILFVLFPIGTIFFIERWSIKDIFTNLGVRKENLKKSILYGLLAAVVTIAITTLIITSSQIDSVYSTVMFFESFTEEFFFRGFLLLYLMKKTSPKVAYATSILGFILIHPQNFDNLFIISTMVQGVLMTVIADKTKNIVGPWVGHGLNRVVPSLLRILF